MEQREQVISALRGAGSPVTTPELVELTGLEARVVDRILWEFPDAFVWQPGHRWALNPGRKDFGRVASPNVLDSRAAPLVPREAEELRALTLASGLELRISRRPMDSDAFFSVRSSGNRVDLVLNSTHELFDELPAMFDDSHPATPYQRAVEVMLEAWALYEDGVPGGPTKRAVEDLRLLWGRRVVEVLREPR